MRTPNAVGGVVIQGNGGEIALSYVSTIPSDGAAGYLKGCILVKTNETDGTCGLFVNVGTATSCNFDRLALAS